MSHCIIDDERCERQAAMIHSTTAKNIKSIQVSAGTGAAATTNSNGTALRRKLNVAWGHVTKKQ